MPHIVRMVTPVDPANVKQTAQQVYDAIQRALQGEAPDAPAAPAASTGGGYAGPGNSFPVFSAADVMTAWSLAEHAADPQAVRASIARIAKANGWQNALPEEAR